MLGGLVRFVVSSVAPREMLHRTEPRQSPTTFAAMNGHVKDQPRRIVVRAGKPAAIGAIVTAPLGRIASVGTGP